VLRLGERELGKCELGKRGVLSNVANRLPALARRHRIPGVQIALYRDGEIDAMDLGELRFRSTERVTPESAFPAGSITKAFTATLAMMLVADGDLELDAPLGDYLPELDAVTGPLTLYQLLSHTGGLAAGPDSEDVATATLGRYVRDHVRRHNLLLPAGAAFSYSNMGYILTGLLIETITGMSWHEAVSSILCQPLGIEPAFVCGRDAPPAARPVASGHSVNLAMGRTRPVRQSLADAEAPAGGLALSATDLVALGRMHLDGGVPGLLPPDWAARMRVAVPAAEPFGLADGWGLGLAVFNCALPDGTGGTQWVGHDGNADGTACYLRIDPAGGSVVAMTSNAGTGLALWRDLIAELGGAGVPIEPASAWSAAAPVVPASSGCVGTYVNGGLEYSVVPRKDGLYLLVDDSPPTRLTFHSGSTFSLRDPSSGAQVFGGRFLHDETTGRVTALQMGGRLARRQRYAAPSGRRDLTA
jgi:CubicO group peptidase (beta-lactamase class C family)